MDDIFIKKLKQHFSKTNVLDWKPSYKEIEELTNVSSQGRSAYAIMCAENYLLNRYPEKEWGILFRDIWKITSVRYWDGWISYIIECIPESLEEFASYELSRFEYLSKNRYDELKGLYKNTGKDVNTILRMVWDFANFHLIGGIREKYLNIHSLQALEDMLDFLKSAGVSFPDTRELQKYIITKHDCRGEGFDGTKLSKFKITKTKRITKVDLECEELMWFGLDKQNHIFVCINNGYGNVPEFICKNREHYERLLDYFLNEAKETEPVVLKEYNSNLDSSLDEKEITDPYLLVEYKINQFYKECSLLSSKGIFCYRVVALMNPEQYKKISEPVQPLNLKDLTDEIKTMICDNKLNVNVKEDRTIEVEHAY